MFSDPLFQQTLVETVRSNPDLINPEGQPSLFDTISSQRNWTGLPVIFDEVFTGIYRLGHFNTSNLLGVSPDIIVNAKLLTGGLVPLCTTTASQEIFEAFLSNQKTDALLHGHSYTAHVVGCNVAVDSLKRMEKMEGQGSWDTFRNDWAEGEPARNAVWSMWSRDFVIRASNIEQVDYIVSMGSVLAISLKDAQGSGKSLRATILMCVAHHVTGYNSIAALGLHKALLRSDGHGWTIHSRVLGNILYLMASLTTPKATIRSIEARLLEELETRHNVYVPI